jgi:hypothetical protein
LKTSLIRSCFFTNDFLFKFSFIRNGLHMCGIHENVFSTY